MRLRFGTRVILDGLTLKVERGTVGLVGPNGAGKSTLIRLLLGLLRFEGAATVFEHDVRTEPLLVRSRVGYFPERDELVPRLSAVLHAAYAGELCGLPPAEALERAHAALDFAGLGDKRLQPVGSYSTGMKQRVKLASALVHGPELLVADEPTNGLDPEGRAEMLLLLASLPARAGCSVLLSSHLLPDVEAACEQAILLHHGKMLFAGPLAELRGRDQGHTGRYDVRVKSDPGRLAEALRAAHFTVEQNGPALRVDPPANAGRSGAVTTDIFAVAHAAGIQVRHLVPATLSLEQAFLDAVAAPPRERT